MKAAVLGITISETITVKILHAPQGHDWMNAASEWLLGMYSAKAESALKTADFSGGNQQKDRIARKSSKEPDILLICQPTTR